MVKHDSQKIDYQLHIDSGYYNTLDIEGFSRMMKDPSYCYKFYWLEAIVQLISEDKKEASYDEICLPENIQRLSYELSNANVIICMGDRADFAVHSAVVSGKIVKGEHLSAMHINRSYTSTADSPSTRRFDRISQVANKILEQL